MSLGAHHEQFGTSVRERIAALAVACIAIALGAAFFPMGARLVAPIPGLASALAAAAIVALLVTAAILRNQYCATGFPPYAFLGAAYMCAAGLMLPLAIVLLAPPALAQSERITHVTMWLDTAYHAAFIALAGVYVWSQALFARKGALEERELERLIERDRDTVRGYAAVTAVLAGFTGLAALWAAGALPLAFLNAVGLHALVIPAAPHLYLTVQRVMLGLCAVVASGLVLQTRLRQPLQLWLAVVLILFVWQVFMGANSPPVPYSVAWYVGLGQGFAWQITLLFVLLRRANDQIEGLAEDKRSLIEETQADALTGLHNRRGFDERLAAALEEAAQKDGTVALVALDLDHFKAYNDHFGHIAGDEALKNVGRALTTVVTRQRDAACRIGGEEFAVILPFTDEEGAMTIAERIRAQILHMNVQHAPGYDRLTVSVGLAVALGGQIDSKTLYGRADKALYRAKRTGRNRIQRYLPALERNADESLRAG
jgi:diguanylate cyclase (GGDEF)-like protein